MLAMHLIDEPDVIGLLNNGRFEGDVEGYIMMEDSAYLGHALFKVEEGITTVLDSSVENKQQLDGIIRACVASGERRNAEQFYVNQNHPPLAHWWQVFCKEFDGPAPVTHIFELCN